jgi:hypothetical protein
MKANELRIGNWLYSGIAGQNFIASAHDIMNIFFGDDRGAVQPIPLTEEWLLNFGFEPDKDNAHFLNKEPFTLKEHPEGFVVWHKGHALGIVIKHVHQLQNLYFALTGEELKQEQQ